jgi:DNA topoisomerase-3
LRLSDSPSEPLTDRTEGERIASLCNGGKLVSASWKAKSIKKTHPALRSHQLAAGRQPLLGYTAQQTLDYAQALYEKKLATYPRTDSRYLTSHMADGVQALADTIMNACRFLVMVRSPATFAVWTTARSAIIMR